MAEFTLYVEAAIGPAATEADFVHGLEEFQTPTFEPYKGTKIQNPPSFLTVTILIPSTNT